MLQNSDRELIDQVLNGDAQEANYAYSLLIEKYQKQIYWHIRRYMHTHEETDDVAQEVWIKVWNSINSFRGDSQFYFWLCRIASNAAVSALRKNAKLRTNSLEDYELELIDNEMPDDAFKEEEEENNFNKQYKKAIIKLSERQRLIFNLVFYEEMKHKDIAELLNLSLGTIKSTYHNAIQNLKKNIDHDSTI